MSLPLDSAGWARLLIRQCVGRKGRGRREAICPRGDLSLLCDACFRGSRAGVQRGRMFPNFRLMIAAAFASVVVLVSAFGVFASFHVSHRPLVRLPSANASLQLLRADYAEFATFAHGGTDRPPLEHRFRIGVTLPSGPPRPAPSLGTMPPSSQTTAAPEPRPAESDETAVRCRPRDEQAARRSGARSGAVCRSIATMRQREQTAVADACTPMQSRTSRGAGNETAPRPPPKRSAQHRPPQRRSVAAVEPAIAEPPAEQAAPGRTNSRNRNCARGSRRRVPAPPTPEIRRRRSRRRRPSTSGSPKAHRAHRSRAGQVVRGRAKFQTEHNVVGGHFSDRSAKRGRAQTQKQPAKYPALQNRRRSTALTRALRWAARLSAHQANKLTHRVDRRPTCAHVCGLTGISPQSARAPAFRPRFVARHHRHAGIGGLAQLARSGAARRPARLYALLARRAP